MPDVLCKRISPRARAACSAGSLSMLILVLSAPVCAQSEKQDGVEFFKTQVKPVLSANCFGCHGADGKKKGGLRLTSRSAILKGGETGPAVDLDEPAESLLVSAINYESYEMPPKGKLPDDQIAILTRWIQMGMPFPSEVTHEAHERDGGGPPPIDAKAKRFWSFQPVKPVAIPSIKSDWIRTPIDAFVLSRLQQAGQQPAPPAERAALLRRAYYDLIGLPPTPPEVRAFLTDESVDAFEKVVDQLLDSPHYGERWGRHWLDLVRYAESNSYERDDPKPFVWRYRDYVIRAFNDDKPYDQFIREQLAGDELEQVTRDSIIATGYYRLGIWQDEPVDPEQELFEDLDDLVRTTGEVFLGLTIGCARCHDHKLDPIAQRDYYSFVAFFRNVRRFGIRSAETVKGASIRTIDTEEQRQQYQHAVSKHQADLKENRERLRKIERNLKKDLVGVEVDEWKTELARIDIARKRIGGILSEEQFDEYVMLSEKRQQLRMFKPPGLAQALCVKEHGRTSPPTHILIRGNAHVPGEEVPPGFPQVLSPPAPQIDELSPEVASSGRRLALARWIVNPANPLTSRVMVNRIWQFHFGRGIVESANDFGFQGIRPTHPQLLDWLAGQFVDGGWRMKSIHKLIMLSSTYRMSSRANDQGLAEDPTNRLFWRFDMRRLSAEELRDSVLAVNGELNRDKMFGPSIYVPIEKEVLAGQSRPGAGWGDSSPEDQARRTIYIHVKRSLVVPMIATFDGPDTDSSCPVRFNTTQPTQSLVMLNSQFVNNQASAFARYLQQEAGDDTAAQVRLALLRTLQREPLEHEVTRGTRLIEVLRHELEMSPFDALQRFCVASLNLNEFIYLD